MGEMTSATLTAPRRDDARRRHPLAHRAPARRRLRRRGGARARPRPRRRPPPRRLAPRARLPGRHRAGDSLLAARSRRQDQPPSRIRPAWIAAASRTRAPDAGSHRLEAGSPGGSNASQSAGRPLGGSTQPARGEALSPSKTGRSPWTSVRRCPAGAPEAAAEERGLPGDELTDAAERSVGAAERVRGSDARRRRRSSKVAGRPRRARRARGARARLEPPRSSAPVTIDAGSVAAGCVPATRDRSSAHPQPRSTTWRPGASESAATSVGLLLESGASKTSRACEAPRVARLTHGAASAAARVARSDSCPGSSRHVQLCGADLTGLVHPRLAARARARPGRGGPRARRARRAPARRSATSRSPGSDPASVSMSWVEV